MSLQLAFIASVGAVFLLHQLPTHLWESDNDRHRGKMPWCLGRGYASEPCKQPNHRLRVDKDYQCIFLLEQGGWYFADFLSKGAMSKVPSTMNKTSCRILVVLPKTEFILQRCSGEHHRHGTISITVAKGHIMYLNSSFPPSLFLEEFESQYSPRKSWKESYPRLELHAKKSKKTNVCTPAGPLPPLWTITTVSISIIDLAKTRAWKLRWSQPLKLFQAKALLANGTWGCPHCASIHHWDFPLESFSGALHGSSRVDPSFSCRVAHIKDLGFVGLVDQKSYNPTHKVLRRRVDCVWCEKFEDPSKIWGEVVLKSNNPGVGLSSWWRTSYTTRWCNHPNDVNHYQRSWENMKRHQISFFPRSAM